MDGHLLRATFPEAQIHVFDLNPQQTDSSVRYHTSLNDVVESGPFDLIGSFHIFEHIPEPVRELASYRAFIEKGTVLCVEVPMEYVGPLIKRKGIPLGPHVNYFTRFSLRHLAKSQGYEVLKTGVANAWYGENRLTVIRGLFKYVGETDSSEAKQRRPAWLLDFTLDTWIKCIGKVMNKFI